MLSKKDKYFYGNLLFWFLMIIPGLIYKIDSIYHNLGLLLSLIVMVIVDRTTNFFMD